MALLRCGEVRIAVASRKQQAADQAMFRHSAWSRPSRRSCAQELGAFPCGFGAIAGRIMVVEAPGPNVADPPGCRSGSSGPECG